MSVCYEYYENGNRVIRFDRDPHRYPAEAKVEQWDHKTNDWIPARSSGLAWEVQGFQPDWSFLPEDQVAEFISKRYAPKDG